MKKTLTILILQEVLPIFGVDYIDLRDTLISTGKDFYSFFYKTEHHWNCFGGFEGFKAIVNHTSDMYGDKIEERAFNIDNYKVDKYEERHSGYYGNCVGNFFIPAEDFYLLYPKFKTEQICYIPHKKLIRKGTFYDAIFEQSFLKGNMVRRMYRSYIGGDFPLVIHKSKTAKTDKTIMLFIDSFGNIPESFLTTVYKKVIAVDLRWIKLKKLNKTAIDFIKEYKPDHVVVTYNPNQLVADSDSEVSENAQFQYGLNKIK